MLRYGTCYFVLSVLGTVLASYSLLRSHCGRPSPGVLFVASVEAWTGVSRCPIRCFGRTVDRRVPVSYSLLRSKRGQECTGVLYVASVEPLTGVARFHYRFYCRTVGLRC